MSTGALSMEEQEQAKPSRQMLLERKLAERNLCRMCGQIVGQRKEGVNYIISECSKLSFKRYARDDMV